MFRLYLEIGEEAEQTVSMRGQFLSGCRHASDEHQMQVNH